MNLSKIIKGILNLNFQEIEEPEHINGKVTMDNSLAFKTKRLCLAKRFMVELKYCITPYKISMVKISDVLLKIKYYPCIKREKTKQGKNFDTPPDNKIKEG